MRMHACVHARSTHRLKSRCSVRIMIIATMPVRKSTIMSELTIENQWICSSPIRRYVSHRDAHLISLASHLTSYVKMTSPGPLIASGTADAPPPHVLREEAAPFHSPLTACLTEEGSTSKPTMRAPSKLSSLWYLIVRSRWLFR